ncbi:hypothetical protein [Bosea vaviloviae]|nr:hypothetical protein [Bosea vaviloviae]
MGRFAVFWQAVTEAPRCAIGRCSQPLPITKRRDIFRASADGAAS